MADPSFIKLEALKLKKAPPNGQLDEEEDIGDEEATLIDAPKRRDAEHRQKRKALLRAILLLLASAIATITVGAMLTKFEGAFKYTHKKWRMFQGYKPYWNSNASRKIPSNRFEGVELDWTRKFQRDPAEYILRRPNWKDRRLPKIKYYKWTITDTVANPDGVMRPLFLINGKFPGPKIECLEDDVINIDIDNQSGSATSFHWHGIIQNGTAGDDGVPGMTQCPLPPGGKMTYQFHVNQYGTYWYHAHFQAQYTDGLFGPIVVHSPKEPLSNKYATDQVVMVQDYYHDLSSDKLFDYLAPDNENNEPIPDGALINGRNVIDCDDIDTTYTCNSKGVQRAEINIPPSNSHRLRFINVGAMAEFEIGLDGHSMEVIEADGTPIVPAPYHKLHINVAQRYSVIVHSNGTDADKFWLRARMINHCFSNLEVNIETEVKAIVRYVNPPRRLKLYPDPNNALDSPPPTLPTSLPWNDSNAVICKDEEGALVPSVPMIAPEPDLLFYLRSNFEIGNYSLSRGFFNQSTWKTDLRNPLLYQLRNLHNESDASEMVPEGVMRDGPFEKNGMIIKIDEPKVVDLLIDNFDDGNHPMHLHGHKVWVMSQGTGYFNRSDYATLPREGRLVRDTVTIEGYGYVLLRFVVDHPGLWAFHCHNVWHAEAGLMMAFYTLPDETLDLWIDTVPQEFCTWPNATAGWFDERQVVPAQWRHDNGEE
ncbi:Laccase-2 [Drechslerella dactyloides]|uniref:Laccase-2 n=1 Tax=Drechslerella dactyloides TaxID=74499 RepID=A0AAD6NHZ3_DREDA|nr:Laccase-2 [Drechslerella dactyloides]